MIKTKKIAMNQGKYVLQVEYTGPFQDTKTLSLDFDEVKTRLNQVSRLLGRKATRQDMRDVVKAFVYEAREKGQDAVLPLDPSELLEIDLELGVEELEK